MPTRSLSLAIQSRVQLGALLSQNPWITLTSGFTVYRRGIDILTGLYVLDYSADGGSTWETLVALQPDEDTIIQDKDNLYRHRIVDDEYHIDQTLTPTGYAGIEGTDWKNIYST